MSTKKNKTQARGDPDLDSHLPESQFPHPSSGDNDSTYFLGFGVGSRRNAVKILQHWQQQVLDQCWFWVIWLSPLGEALLPAMREVQSPLGACGPAEDTALCQKKMGFVKSGKYMGIQAPALFTWISSHKSALGRSFLHPHPPQLSAWGWEAGELGS